MLKSLSIFPSNKTKTVEHLIIALRAVRDGLAGIGVVRVEAGIIKRAADDDLRSGRQDLWLFEKILPLPGEPKIRDRDEDFLLARRVFRRDTHVFAAVVHVRREGCKQDVLIERMLRPVQVLLSPGKIVKSCCGYQSPKGSAWAASCINKARACQGPAPRGPS